MAKNEISGKGTTKPPEAIPELPLPPELAKRIPDELKVELSTFMMGPGGHQNPILAKVTPEHIARVLDIAATTTANDHEESKSVRRYQFASFLFALGLFVFLVIFLSEKPVILVPMLTALLGFASGFGVGRKVGKYAYQYRPGRVRGRPAGRRSALADSAREDLSPRHSRPCGLQQLRVLAFQALQPAA